MNLPRRVLVLGSYPCIRPMHGGQIRLAEIISAYRRANYDVQSINLYDAGSAAGQPRGPYDIDYPRQTPFRRWQGKSIPLIDDLTSGQYIAGDERAYQTITSKLVGKPDIIHLEQPWLLPLIYRWRKEGGNLGIRLIYGSQNIEAPLKRSILRQYQVLEADQVAAEIAQLETEACRQADLVLAVSESDRQTLARSTDTPVILAANGIAPWYPDTAHLAIWRERLPKTPFALFVGSAHPPNITGFFEALGDSLGFLPPDQRICVVGSVGPHLPQRPCFQRWKPLNESRIQILGMLDDADLAAVKMLAHVFILPITEGGGSNIKTAEALYSGKHVLGTPISLRGFERFMSMPSVHLAQTAESFRNQLRDLLNKPQPDQQPSWQEARESLLWENTLRPMVNASMKLAHPTQQHNEFL